MKIVGECRYVHRCREREFDKDDLKLAKALMREKLGNFSYDVVKHNRLHDAYSFIQSPDFNTAHEPTVGDAVTVNLATQRVHKSAPKGQIYHHKWLMVPTRYKGFSVMESRKRSRSYEDIPYDKRRAGWRSYWEKEVLPKLEEKRK